MNDLISTLSVSTFTRKASSSFQTLGAAIRKAVKVERVLAAFLAGVLAFGFSVQAAHADESLGERFRDRLEQTDRSTERPKTTGQFKDEVEGDVPLSERIHNTIRDSKEAFEQFGEEYGVGAQESARTLKGKAAEAGDKISDTVR